MTMKTKKSLFAHEYEMFLGWAGNYPTDAPNCQSSIAMAKKLYEQKKYAVSIEHYMKLINWRKTVGVVGEGLFKALYTQGQFELARNMVGFLRKDAKKEAPWDYMLAQAWFAEGDYQRTTTYCEQSLIVHPQHHDVYPLLADAYCSLEQWDHAIETMEKYLKLAKESVPLLNRYAIILKKCHQYDRALDIYQKAIRINSQQPISYYNRGLLHLEMGNFKAALSDFELTLKQNPKLHEARNHIASIYLHEGKWSLGFEHLTQTLKADAKNIDALVLSVWFHAIGGRHHAMWKAYEARRLKPFMRQKSKQYKLPSWDGVIDEKCHKLLVWREQGIGDEIMFAGVMQQLLNNSKALKIAYICDQRLHKILGDILPNTQFIAPDDKEQINKAITSCHAQIPIGSLAYRSGLFENWRYQQSAFIAIDTEQAQKKRQDIIAKYTNNPDDVKIIGLNWRSDNRMVGMTRSIELAQILPLLREESFVFMPLQYKMSDEELAFLREELGHRLYYDRDLDCFSDMVGLRDHIGLCDALLSVDNSTLHLAGAMGKKTYALLPNQADWRWLIAPEPTNAGHIPKITNIWYDNISFFHQNGASWNSAMDKLFAKISQDFKIEKPIIAAM